MDSPRPEFPVLVSGFGPFGEVRDNPSARVSRALAREPGVEFVVLPVSFARAPRVWEDALAGMRPRPGLILGTGVHGGEALRVERCARARLQAPAPDIDAARAADLELSGPAALETSVDPGVARDALRAAGVPAEVSADAGGYVCERTYRHLLERGADLGIPALFVHVPHLDRVALDRQVAALRALIAQLRARMRPGPL